MLDSKILAMNNCQILLLCMLFRCLTMDDAKVNAVNITSDFVILYKLYKKNVWKKKLATDDYRIKGFQCIVISFHFRLFSCCSCLCVECFRIFICQCRKMEGWRTEFKATVKTSHLFLWQTLHLFRIWDVFCDGKKYWPNNMKANGTSFSTLFVSKILIVIKYVLIFNIHMPHCNQDLWTWSCQCYQSSPLQFQTFK